jgi:molybdenum cofactor cytidylyltransferase
MQNRRIIEGALRESGAQSRARIETTSISALLSFIRAGWSSIVSETWLKLHGVPPGMRALRLVEPDLGYTIGVVTRETELLPPTVKALLERLPVSDSKAGGARLSGKIASIVLAAGAARRFGGRKQLAQLDGRPLLEHAIASAAKSASDMVVVVLGANADAIESGVDLGGALVVRCPDWEQGRHASLRAGLAALDPGVAAALITLGDEPFLASAASDRLIEARRPDLEVLRATHDGRPGHPVLVERPLFATLMALSEPGASPAAVLREARGEAVPCEDLGGSVDVDTRADLARLEADNRQGSSRSM